MAVSKNIDTTSFLIEVENGTNDKGDIVYRKKTFSNVKTNANVGNVLNVADGIKKVLSKNSRDIYINESSKLISE